MADKDSRSGPGAPEQPRRPDANNAEAQIATVREYAVRVFGKETTAAAWLGGVNRAVLNGRCTVAEACGTTEGFLAAMLELARLNTKADPLHAAANPPEMLEGDRSAPLTPPAANDSTSRRH